MTVLEFAKMRMFDEQQHRNLLEARLYSDVERDIEDIKSKIRLADLDICYWRAYIDGAEAQKNEDGSSGIDWMTL